MCSARNFSVNLAASSHFAANSAERIRPVEHNELDSFFGRGFHAFNHRADVGVTAAADVLEIENEHIDSLQHRGSRLACRAVKRERRETCYWIFSVRDV